MRLTQNNFTKGELDPSLLGRYDLDTYQKGARRMRNMFSLWTGAATIAPGQIYVDTIEDRTASPNAKVTNPIYVKGVMFEYDANNEIRYTIVARPDTTDTVAFDIYYDDTLQASVPGAAFTVAQITLLHFAVGQDRVIILLDDTPTYQLVRGADHVTWTLSAFTFSTKPVFDFTVLGGTQYRVAGFTFTPSATSGTGHTLVASSAIYNSNHVGGLFSGGGGIARITSVASTTSCTIDILEDFTSTSAIKGTEASLNEVMWTSGGGSPAGPDRGWPSRGIFYLDRFALGNSSTLRNVMAFSTTGVFDDFDDSDYDASYGFTFTMNYKGNDSLQDFGGDDAIIFFGATTLYATNPLTESSVNVTDFYAPPQGGDGTGDVPVVSMDNQIFYVNTDRSQINTVYYDTGKAKLNSLPATILSSHLVEKVSSMAPWLPSNFTAKLLLCTQDDGSMLILSTLEDQIVNAWSLRTTAGNYIQVMGIKNEAMVLVQRATNTGTVYDINPEHVYYTGENMDGFNNITASVDGSTNVTVLANNYDYLVIGYEAPYTALNFTVSTPASADCDLTFEYMDFNGEWNLFDVTDGTTGLTGTGAISWDFTDVPNWAPNDIYDTRNLVQNQFWIRIRRTAVTVTTAPVISEIEMNMSYDIYLERLDISAYMDSQINTSSNSSGAVTGLAHLAGQQVYAIHDGATQGPYYVNEDGETNITEEYASVDIGIRYIPELVPMPLYTPTPDGDNSYEQRYFKKIYIDYVDSLYIQAEDKDIGCIELGSYTLDSNNEPQSGFYIINPMGDWEPRQEIKITQSSPGPMTIRAIGYEVEIS